MDTQRVFEMVYRRNPQRRKHSHRCIQCSRIVKDGETVVMVLMQRGSKVVHTKCDHLHPDFPTWTDAFKEWDVRGY